MRKRFIVVIVFMFMAVPVYAHVYDEPNDVEGFEGFDLGPLILQEGTKMWWALPFNDNTSSPTYHPPYFYPYMDAVVELDPALADPNDNQVLNIAGTPGGSGASLNDDWLWIDGFIHEPNEGTWIVVEFDLWLEAGTGTGGRRFALLFYDNDSSDPVSVGFGRTTPGQVTNKTSGVHVPVPGYSFDDETWMRVRFVLDQGTDTLDLYIDGVLLLDGAGIANDAISCERVAFATRDNNSKVLIDNLITEVLYEDVPPPPYCGDGNHALLTGDVSGPVGKPDCYVDIYDLDAIVQRWLDCTDPAEPLCN
jgi:hypothetical protein